MMPDFSDSDRDLSTAFWDYVDADPLEICLLASRGTNKNCQTTRGELTDAARSVAGGIADFGLKEGDCVAIALPNSFEQWVAFWGCQILGLIVCMIPPIIDVKSLQYSLLMLQRTKRNLRVSAIILYNAASYRSHSAGMPLLDIVDLLTSSPISPGIARNPARLSVVQFTSGSTGGPKACLMTSGGFVRNAEKVARRLEVADGDSLVTWLPTFHDMGLLSALILPVTTKCSLCFRTPRRFLMNPVSWLRDLGTDSRSHSTVPNFALALATKQLARGIHSDINLESVASIVCGAEPIDAYTADEFLRVAATHGLRREAFHAAYGMAEATLMVTSRPGGLAFATNPSHAADRATSPSAEPQLRRAVVSLGKPIQGVRVKISPHPHCKEEDAYVGEILIQSDCMMQAQIDGDNIKAIAESDWFKTGDLGFIVDGELYVSGRLKDIVIIAGANYFPPEIEACLSRDLEVDQMRIAVFGRPGPLSTEELCVLIESRPGVCLDTMVSKVNACCVNRFGIAPADVIFAGRGSILRTSSGKIRRSEIAQNVAGGDFDRIE